MATVVRPGAPVGPQTATTRPGAARGDRVRQRVGRRVEGRIGAGREHRLGEAADLGDGEQVLDAEPAEPLRVSLEQVRRAPPPRPVPDRAARSVATLSASSPGSVGDSTTTRAVPVLAVASRSVRSTQRRLTATDALLPSPSSASASQPAPAAATRTATFSEITCGAHVRGSLLDGQQQVAVGQRRDRRGQPARRARSARRRRPTGWWRDRATCPPREPRRTGTSSNTSVRGPATRRPSSRPPRPRTRRSGVTQTSTVVPTRTDAGAASAASESGTSVSEASGGGAQCGAWQQLAGAHRAAERRRPPAASSSADT